MQKDEEYLLNNSFEPFDTTYSDLINNSKSIQ